MYGPYSKTILLNGVDPLTHITDVAIHCGYDIDKLSWITVTESPCNYKLPSTVSSLHSATEH